MEIPGGKKLFASRLCNQIRTVLARSRSLVAQIGNWYSRRRSQAGWQIYIHTCLSEAMQMKRRGS